MNFLLNEDQNALVEAMEAVCSQFSDEYWAEIDRKAEFPHAFHKALAEGGWLGIAMPESYGGAGLGIFEAALMMKTIARSGAGFSGASAVHMNIFGLNPLVVFGSNSQRQNALPPLISGEDKACFAVTEPNAGLDTTKLETRAEKQGDHYIVSGQKIWISTAQVANKMLLLARTTPLSDVKKHTDGLSLFYTDIDREKISIKEIDKMGRHGVDSNILFIDGLRIPETDLIGKEGKGFSYILHGLNPERILIAAEAIGLGQAALNKATIYANERIVFGRPIGKNQGIQHPLAENWMELEAADLVIQKAAWLYDNNLHCGSHANAGKYLAAEACFQACQTAVQTLGGMGYASEYHVERYLRESFIPRLAPVSPQLILCYIAEKVLGLPRSY